VNFGRGFARCASQREIQDRFDEEPRIIGVHRRGKSWPGQRGGLGTLGGIGTPQGTVGEERRTASKYIQILCSLKETRGQTGRSAKRREELRALLTSLSGFNADGGLESVS